LKDWQREGGGLSAAGLRASEQVTPFDQVRDGLELDGRGLGVFLRADCAQERFDESKARK
jgi:hypothetical protein